MKSHLYHLQLNINFKNAQFYKKFLEFMEWEIIFENEEIFGYHSKSGPDVWFIEANKSDFQDYDSIGVNHISFRVDKISDVDEVKDYLEKSGVKMLFGTPKHRSEFSDEENDTYYQIMFESPDKILFEVVYVGPK